MFSSSGAVAGDQSVADSWITGIRHRLFSHPRHSKPSFPRRRRSNPSASRRRRSKPSDQGNALGTRVFQHSWALQGRNSDGGSFALTGLEMYRWDESPGRCPGLL